MYLILAGMAFQPQKMVGYELDPAVVMAGRMYMGEQCTLERHISVPQVAT